MRIRFIMVLTVNVRRRGRRHGACRMPRRGRKIWRALARAGGARASKPLSTGSWRAQSRPAQALPSRHAAASATRAPKSDLAAFSAIRAADIIEDDNLKAIKETLEESELSLENIALSLLVDQWIYLKKHHRWTFYPQVQPVLEFARDNHALYRHCGGRGSTSGSLCHLGPGEAGVWVFGQCSPCRYLA